MASGGTPEATPEYEPEAERNDTDAPDGSSTNSTLVLGVAFFLVLTIAALLWTRREDDDEWSITADSWEAAALSEDGRTLSVELYDSGNCDEPDRLELEGDLDSNEEVVATAYVRRQTKKDGEVVTCSTGLDLEGLVVTIELDDPIPDGVILVDGASTAAGCATVTEQVLERGSRLPGSNRIDPC
jgi:hypothetical protein